MEFLLRREPPRSANDEPPNADTWAGVAPYYRVELEGFVPIENPPPLGDLLKQRRAAIAEEINAIKASPHAGEFAVGVRQSREPAIVHPHRQIQPLA